MMRLAALSYTGKFKRIVPHAIVAVLALQPFGLPLAALGAFGYQLGEGRTANVCVLASSLRYAGLSPAALAASPL
jgi:hypothetical protein